MSYDPSDSLPDNWKDEANRQADENLDQAVNDYYGDK
jgi:hypothetical protein